MSANFAAENVVRNFSLVRDLNHPFKCLHFAFVFADGKHLLQFDMCTLLMYIYVEWSILLLILILLPIMAGRSRLEAQSNCLFIPPHLMFCTHNICG